MFWLNTLFKEESKEEKERKIFKTFLSEVSEKTHVLGVYDYNLSLDFYHETHWQHSLNALKNNNPDSYLKQTNDYTQERILGIIEAFVDSEYIKFLNLDKLKVQQWKHDCLEEIKTKGPVETYKSTDYYTYGRNYSVYRIDFNDFIEKVCTEDQKQIYKQVKASLTPAVKSKMKP